ncbi:thiamine pyrophosphate-binding protein [Sulfurospirillum halorespirans]|uniref:IlvB acetolactate synthase-like protein n=1 Tax=Sulfurospirillum halorespirans DSM 13726 TaxID=1193502 RepID=A0A1D7TLX2_9BACT|nr:thiamine pyrophosphate-binding protein [Sulfurospirillum halorespirans]AOO65986.1 IlvB acetolactate synthase-like protein [Sulfurospirillum halorespirans DSM 13726]
MNIRVADYLTQKLAEVSGNKLFMITGGMIMHLTDAVYKQKDTLDTYFFHHEQAATMAAEAYARYSKKIGVVYVTAGPAALNTLTGVVGAYVDRSPCIIVSGQSKVEQVHVTAPRQFSLQGFNTLPIFEQVTKFAVILDDIRKIKYNIEKAIFMAHQAPFGPVWIECPLDIQGATFDPDLYDGFIPDTASVNSKACNIEVIIQELKKAKRPVILMGAGVQQADAVKEANLIADTFGIPIVTTRMGMDILDHEHPNFIGKPGTYGDRAGNFTVQNSDVLLVLGSRLSIGLIGHDYQAFAPNSKIILVEIDPKEFEKPSVDKAIKVLCDVKVCMKLLLDQFKPNQESYITWLRKAQEWKEKYPVDLPEYVNETEGVNSYHFMRVFSEYLDKNAVIVTDTGSCFHVHAQAFKIKFGQRHIITGGLSTMGYSPASIGVAASAKDEGKDVYCISGDGSIQMNLQEFQTIAYYNLPIKTIILNNNGYLLIRHTQNNFMEGRLIGESSATGVSTPSMEKVATLYGIKYIGVSNIGEMNEKIKELIAYNGPVIFEVMTPTNQLLIPRVASKKLDDGKMVSMPYDDMFPFLPRSEYEENINMEF